MDEHIINESDSLGEEDSQQMNQVVARLFVRAADQIRHFNKLGEVQFQLMSRAHNGRGRQHFIYRALDEIEKIVFFLINDKGEMPVPEHFDDREKRLLRNMSSKIEVEQALVIRQLVELLGHLICFSQTNTKAYFDHFLLYRELDQLDFYLRDTKEYFGAESSNQAWYRDALVRSIVWAEERLDIAKCWYLKKPVTGGKAKKAPFSDIFPKAVSIGSKFEKAAIGLSYGLFYGDYSQAIHLQVGNVRGAPSINDLKANELRILYLCVCCLRRTSKLSGIRARKGELADLVLIEKGLRERSLFSTFSQPDISKGDFVTTGNALCEVLRVVRTKYGYRSFQLRYLSRPPIEEITQDWFPAHQVRKFASHKELREHALDLLTIDGVRPHIPRGNARKVRNAMRSSADYLLHPENHFR